MAETTEKQTKVDDAVHVVVDEILAIVAEALEKSPKLRKALAHAIREMEKSGDL